MSTSSNPLGLLNPSSEKGYKKLADDDEPLYEGSPQSKYQFALALYNWKIECNVRDACFEQFLRLFKSAFRNAKVVGSIDEVKKVLEKLGITYEEVSEEQEEVDDDSDDSNEDGDDHE
ncbi:hypothetical protein CTI12_AA485720 [Artemisia annua]|uniref:Uncharacterized protein n=1 Tax=Artemisia annua TaxID=35608 RepID=A0A2U1LG48_ARTAN|nr:hypothetical protein CTI12_AA485720 [Artemisia annua]